MKTVLTSTAVALLLLTAGCGTAPVDAIDTNLAGNAGKPAEMNAAEIDAALATANTMDAEAAAADAGEGNGR